MVGGGLAAGGKGLNDDHAAATARTRIRGGRRLVGSGGVVRVVLRFWQGEQLARSRKIFRTGRLGQKPVVTNAMEALRQDVGEEAADELTCCERHDFVASLAVATIILVTEGDAVVAFCPRRQPLRRSIAYINEYPDEKTARRLMAAWMQLAAIEASLKASRKRSGLGIYFD